AYNAVGFSQPASNTASATSNGAAPPPPAITNSANNVSATSAPLNATINPKGTTTTTLEERRGGTGSFTELVRVTAGTNSYVDSAVSAGTGYTYRVYAYNAVGFSQPASNTASATSNGAAQPPLAITNSANNVAATSARLNATINPKGTTTT